ncbi:MAG: ABC transporter permease, partial [Vicinamibacterales bacterium]
MAWLARITGGFNALFRKRRVEQDLDEELRGYLESSVDQKIRAGMAREDAMRAARIEIGSLEAVKDYTRDVGWESVLDSLWQDVRYACRLLRRNPGFSTAATITLALGIGANTAVFSIVDATLLKPLPFQHADRLVDILEIRRPRTAEEAAYSGMARARLEEWRAQTHIFDGIGALKTPRPMSFGKSGPAIRVARVSPEMFPLLGLSPVIGRNFSQAESAQGDDQVLLISDGLWKRAFGSSREVIGRQILLDNRTVTVIGVMPPEARFPVGGDAWLPLTNTIDPQDPASGIVGIVARLREGLTPSSAQADVARAAEAIQASQRTREPWTARVESIDPRGWLTGSQPVVLIAFGAVAFV